MEKANFFKIEDNYLKIYIKIPLFENFGNIARIYRNKYSNEFENYLGESIDITGKYLILTFVLRSKKDILPYLKYSEVKNEGI